MDTTPAVAPRRSRWARRLALLVAATVAGVGTLTATAQSPAQAGLWITYCFPVVQHGPGGWHHIYWICRDLYYGHSAELPDYGLELRTDLELPVEVQRGYLERLGDGVSLLAQARTADARTAAALRAQAQEAFLDSARHLRDARVSAGQVGIAHVEDVKLEPMPLPWLQASAVDLADGLGLMQRAVTDPSPQPWIRAGMAEFDSAVAQMTARRG